MEVSIFLDGRRLGEEERIILEGSRQAVVTLRAKALRNLSIERLTIDALIGGIRLPLAERALGLELPPGGELNSTIVLALRAGGINLLTGLYLVGFSLHYEVEGVPKVWMGEVEIYVPDLFSIATAVTLASALAVTKAMVGLVKAATSFIPPPQALLPTNTMARPHEKLFEFARERLEPAARGRLVASLTSTIERRIRKDRCPICYEPYKDGRCPKDGLRRKEAEELYKEKIREMVLRLSREMGEAGTTGSRAISLQEVMERLQVDRRIACDVLVAMAGARLVRLKGFAKKLMGRALRLGINLTLATILLVTVGGLGVLGEEILVAIIALSFAIPFLIVIVSGRAK